MRFALPLGIAAAVLISGSVLAADAGSAAVSEPLPPKDVSFSFEGPFGHYDRAALQRGFQIYKEVCSACHSLKRVAFHNLSDEGGPEFSEAEAKAIAAGYQVLAGPNDKGEVNDANGEPLKRPGTLADYFPSPFANEAAARTANGGALPPDLSLIVKAREGGPRYVYSIITGFHETPPKDFKVPEGKYYDPYFPTRDIAMPQPLSDGSVTYVDGTKATTDQEAHDVVTFLAWAAEPKLEARHRMGFGVMAFLLVFAGLCYLAYVRTWRDLH